MLSLLRIQRLAAINPVKAMRFVQERADRLVHIWSAEHGAWWRPDRCGYTTAVLEAGVYLLADAYDATSHCGPEKQIYYQSYLPF